MYAAQSGGLVRRLSERRSQDHGRNAYATTIVLRNYEPRSIKAPRYSKRLLLLRDGYCCQYCRQRFHSSQLTADHVIPRAAGGKSSWDNIVASCMPSFAAVSDEGVRLCDEGVSEAWYCCKKAAVDCCCCWGVVFCCTAASALVAPFALGVCPAIVRCFLAHLSQ